MSRTRAQTRQPPCRRQPSTVTTTRRQVWRVALLLGILIASRVNAEQGSKRGGSSAVSPSSTTGKATTSNRSSHSQSSSSKQQDELQVLQITETKIWNGSKWKSGESRWTRPDNDSRVRHPTSKYLHRASNLIENGKLLPVDRVVIRTVGNTPWYNPSPFDEGYFVQGNGKGNAIKHTNNRSQYMSIC